MYIEFEAFLDRYFCGWRFFLVSTLSAKFDKFDPIAQKKLRNN